MADISSRGARQASVFGRVFARHNRISGQLATDVLLGFEAVVIIFAAVLSQWLVESIGIWSPLRDQSYELVGLIGGVLTVATLRGMGHNTTKAALRGASEWRDLIFGLGISFLCMGGLGYFLKISTQYSRPWLAIWFITASLLLLAWRACVGQILLALVRGGGIERRVAVVGAEGGVSPIAGRLGQELGLRLTRTFSMPAQDLEETAAASASAIASLSEASRRDEFDEIIIEAHSLSAAQLQAVLNELRPLPNDVWLNLCPAGLALVFHEADQIGGFSVVKVRRRPIDGWSFVLKQAVDYTLSFVALIALSPLFLVTAVAIKLDTRGPIFFRQKRIGYNEKVISIYKFRTMTVVEDGPNVRQAQKNDDRITRVGHFLRCTSLDELPQLINVLKGEMSLVGPRPHALAHHELYAPLMQDYTARHRVKPGITGLSQVNGLRGLTDTPEKMQRRVAKDLEYIEQWSFLLDLKILLLTPAYGFINRNAF